MTVARMGKQPGNNVRKLQFRRGHVFVLQRDGRWEMVARLGTTSSRTERASGQKREDEAVSDIVRDLQKLQQRIRRIGNDVLSKKVGDVHIALTRTRHCSNISRTSTDESLNTTQQASYANIDSFRPAIQETRSNDSLGKASLLQARPSFAKHNWSREWSRGSSSSSESSHSEQHNDLPKPLRQARITDYFQSRTATNTA